MIVILEAFFKQKIASLAQPSPPCRRDRLKLRRGWRLSGPFRRFSLIARFRTDLELYKFMKSKFDQMAS